MKGPPTNERTPQPEQPCAAPSPARTERKTKPVDQNEPRAFDSLLAHHYPAVYNFASRLTDDPQEAVLLTYRTFNSIRKQLWLPRDEIALVRILLKAVVRASVTTA